MTRKKLGSYRPSPGTVIAIVALIAALTGTAWAAKIGTKQLAKGAVTAKKIKNGAVKNAKLADGAVTEAKVANGAVTDAKLGNVIVRSIPVNVPDGGAGGQSIQCNTGEKMLGGGARFVNSGNATDLALISSGPVNTGDNNAPADGTTLGAWRGAGSNQAGATGAFPLTVFALCLQ
jgi:hypothetical protein